MLQVFKWWAEYPVINVSGDWSIGISGFMLPKVQWIIDLDAESTQALYFANDEACGFVWYWALYCWSGDCYY